MVRQTGNAMIMAPPFVTIMEEIDNRVNILAMVVYLQLFVSGGVRTLILAALASLFARLT